MLTSRTQSSWRRALLIATCLTPVLLAGCAREPVQMDQIHVTTPKRQEAINNFEEAAVITLETEPNEFWSVDYDRGDPLPDVMVGPVSANDVSVAGLVEILSKSLNIGVVKDKEITQRRINYSDPRRRPLKDILETVTRTTGLFYEFHDGIISFDTKRKFFVRVPRVMGYRATWPNDSDRSSSSGQNQDGGSSSGGDVKREYQNYDDKGSLDSISKAFENLGAENVFVDPISGMVTFTADYRTYRMAQQFMRTFEAGRDMLVYDVWVFERVLRKGEGAGLYWDKLSGKWNGAEYGALTKPMEGLGIGPDKALGGLQFGIISNASKMIMNLLFSMMDEDGATEIVARPTVAMISGQSAEFAVGETQKYISEITNTTGGLATTSQQGVKTKDLDTGLRMIIAGAHSDGVINSRIEFRIDELIAFREFSTGTGSTQNSNQPNSQNNNNNGTSDPNAINININDPTQAAANAQRQQGTTLRLPHTTRRSIRTSLDARVGDLIIIGGLIKGKTEDRGRNLYRTGISTGYDLRQEKTETIMFMRPRLVKIRPKGMASPVKPNVVVDPYIGRAPTGKAGDATVVPEPDRKQVTKEKSLRETILDAEKKLPPGADEKVFGVNPDPQKPTASAPVAPATDAKPKADPAPQPVGTGSDQ